MAAANVLQRCHGSWNNYSPETGGRET